MTIAFWLIGPLQESWQKTAPGHKAAIKSAGGTVCSTREMRHFQAARSCRCLRYVSISAFTSKSNVEISPLNGNSDLAIRFCCSFNLLSAASLIHIGAVGEYFEMRRIRFVCRAFGTPNQKEYPFPSVRSGFACSSIRLLKITSLISSRVIAWRL